MTTSQIESRLSAIELEIALLKRQQAAPRRSPLETLDSIHGTFEDDAAFREAMRLGRKWRRSQDSNAGVARGKRKRK